MTKKKINKKRNPNRKTTAIPDMSEMVPETPAFWTDLVFYHCGTGECVTHRGDPDVHAQLCKRVRDDDDFSRNRAHVRWAATDVPHAYLAEWCFFPFPPDDGWGGIDFSSLDECAEAYATKAVADEGIRDRRKRFPI